MFQKQYENLSPQKITERIPVEWPNEKLCVRPMVFFLQSLAVIGFLTSLPLWGNDIDKVGSKTKGGGAPARFLGWFSESEEESNLFTEPRPMALAAMKLNQKIQVNLTLQMANKEHSHPRVFQTWQYHYVSKMSAPVFTHGFLMSYRF